MESLLQMSDGARVVLAIVILGGGGLSYLMVKMVLQYLSPGSKKNGTAGGQDIAFWDTKFHDIVESVIEDKVLPLLSQERGEAAINELVKLVGDNKVALESARRENVELQRTAREVLDLLRQHLERAQNARTEILVALEDFRHTVEELKGLMTDWKRRQ